MQLQCNIQIQQYIITRFTILKIQGRFVIELKKYTYIYIKEQMKTV